MAYTLVANNGATFGTFVSWTHTFTVGNLCTGQESNDSTNGIGAGDLRDSSATPKNLNLDKASGIFGVCNAGAFSLIVPSGFTSPVQSNSTSQVVTFQEWSGNASSSVVDATNSGGSTTAQASPFSGSSLTTGANAGLVIAVETLNNGSANAQPTVTGTNFSDTFTATHDGTQPDDSAQDGGTTNWRTTSVASTTLNDAWSWTSGNWNNRADVIVSYNVPAAGGAAPPQPRLKMLTGVGL